MLPMPTMTETMVSADLQQFMDTRRTLMYTGHFMTINHTNGHMWNSVTRSLCSPVPIFLLLWIAHAIG